MESILTTIKKMLGIEADYEAFDIDLVVYINMALNVLNQLGVGPEEGFVITSEEETWDDFLDEYPKNKLQMVKTYIYLKVKQVFDPNQNSGITQAFNEQIKELEWRLNVQVDPGESDETE